MFFCEFLQVVEGLFQIDFVFQLFELLQRPVELFFQRFLIDLHGFQLLLHLLHPFRVHLLHELLHLIVHRFQLIVHDLLHQLLQLLLFFNDALFFWRKLIGAIVLFFVRFLQLFQGGFKGLLTFHELFQSPLILPVELVVFPELSPHFRHFFAKRFGFLPGGTHAGGDVFIGLFPFRADFVFGGRCEGVTDGTRHFGPVDLIVVPKLKPIFQHISLHDTNFAEVPLMKKAIRLTRGCFKSRSRDNSSQGFRAFEGEKLLCARSQFKPLVCKTQLTETIIIHGFTGEITPLHLGRINGFGDLDARRQICVCLDVIPDGVDRSNGTVLGNNPVSFACLNSSSGRKGARSARSCLDRFRSKIQAQTFGVFASELPSNFSSFRRLEVADIF